MDRPEDYPHPVAGMIEVHETHISRVYLAGPFAYKLKKPVKTSFLDYSSISLRKKACEEEVRLGRRYADDLYLGVVPIVQTGDRLVVHSSQTLDGDSLIVDYAVQMHRFEDDAILSQRLDHRQVTDTDILDLATTTARFHQHAAAIQGSFESFSKTALHFAIDNLDAISEHPHPSIDRKIEWLRCWTRDTWEQLAATNLERFLAGRVRECHGDLHCGNIVQWSGRWILFDGIEFNPDLSRIDVIDDAAFLMMDLYARGRPDLAHLWINAYLEATGDYDGLHVLRWYLVYRSMVRAKVAAMREHQQESDPQAMRASLRELERYTQLATEFATSQQATELWITHGLSGSGKSTQSLRWIKSHRGIRIRSDVERMRLFGPGQYDTSANQATYERLEQLAQTILDTGYPVIVDATFLQKAQRTRLLRLAQNQGIPFHILDCHADHETLRLRIADRLALGKDPSEADLSVLEKQIQSHEPLDPDERTLAIQADTGE